MSVTAAAVQHQEKQREVAVFDEDLESGAWRMFRLFLVSLEDEGVEHVSKQLEKEQQARRDCENSAARLFFSSLVANDLTLARQAIRNEQAARARERRTVGLREAGRKRRKLAPR